MSDSRYAAIFGRNPALSIAELFAVGAAQGFSVTPLGRAAARLDGFDLKLADRFGAITKVVELIGTAPSADAAIRQLAGTVTKPRTGKVIFGISSYGSRAATELTNRMRELLDRRGVKYRFVGGGSGSGSGGRRSAAALSAVQVKHNKLITKGHDWCLFEAADGWHYGRTVWVYDFEGFAHRDYDKPRSDTKRGMLPPQLARTMVNLATGGDVAKSVYDPFCGSGNVLLESVALGHRTFGSDLDEAAVTDSRKNLEWLDGLAKTSGHRDSDERGDGSGQWDVAVTDATKDLPAGRGDAIVTEGYLGQQVAANTKDRTIESEAKTVESIVLKFCEQAARTLKPGSRLVMTWPIWRLGGSNGRGQLALPLVDRVKALGYAVVRPVPREFSPAELSDRDSILVSRPNQRVIHELFIFERN